MVEGENGFWCFIDCSLGLTSHIGLKLMCAVGKWVKCVVDWGGKGGVKFYLILSRCVGKVCSNRFFLLFVVCIWINQFLPPLLIQLRPLIDDFCEYFLGNLILNLNGNGYRLVPTLIIIYKPHIMAVETVNECFAEMLRVSKNLENILYIFCQ